MISKWEVNLTREGQDRTPWLSHVHDQVCALTWGIYNLMGMISHLMLGWAGLPT